MRPVSGPTSASRIDFAVAAILALALRLCATWAIPLGDGRPDPNCAPDEWEQLFAARDLASGRFAPWPQGESIYATYLPSQYAVQAAALAVGERLGDPAWLYRSVPADPRLRGYPLARLGSVILGVAAVLAIMAAAQCWWGDRRAVRYVGLGAALYPQMIFVSASVNGDAMTLAAAAWLVWALSRWASAGESDAGLHAVGAAAGLVLLGKPYGYCLLVPTAIWIGWASLRGRISRHRLALAIAAGLAVAAPVIAWNAVRSGGDALGLARYAAFISQPGYGRPLPLSPDVVVHLARATLSSAFARFGAMNVSLPSAFYALWLVLVATGAAHGLTRWRKRGTERRDATAARAIAWLAVGLATGFALVVWNASTIAFQPQGRYVLLPVALVTLGALFAPSQLSIGDRATPALSRAGLAFLALSAGATIIALCVTPCG